MLATGSFINPFSCVSEFNSLNLTVRELILKMLEEDNDKRNSIGRCQADTEDCSGHGVCERNPNDNVVRCKCNGDYTGNKCQTAKGRSYLMMVYHGRQIMSEHFFGKTWGGGTPLPRIQNIKRGCNRNLISNIKQKTAFDSIRTRFSGFDITSVDITSLEKFRLKFEFK